MNARTITVGLLAAIALALIHTPAPAQRVRYLRGRWYLRGVPNYYYYYGYPRYGVVWNPFGYYPYGYGYGGTTLAGDVRRGMAQMIRARGLAAENYSRAMVNYQQARSRYIENQKKWLQAYYQRRELGEAHRRAENERRRASRDRYLAALSKQQPERMSPSQLDPNTGKIDWPSALRSSDFDDLRGEIDRLFYVRSHTDTTAGIAVQVREKTRAMHAILKGKIRDLPTDDYIAARTFLALLATEARFPAS